ncbi:MAG: hypothetical protein FWG43_05010 [Clostridiales bacterium]|nr:hypothetical protein [Clostridiales bacterium]
MRKLTYWLVGLAFIIIAIGAVLLLNNIREISGLMAHNASCEATLCDDDGVDISSAFRFSFAGGVSAHTVRRSLSVKPHVDLSYHQGLLSKEVLAVPIEPLQAGQVYKFALQTEKETLYWAFQTKTEELLTIDSTVFSIDQAQASADTWQYIVLSKDIYNSGDTLEFWGYMRHRDNTAWEWSRVSVYVFAAGLYAEPVLQGYAPLTGNIFYGSQLLPLLTPGHYELQIRQSGQLLIAKKFAVESAFYQDNSEDSFVTDNLAHKLDIELKIWESSIRFTVKDDMGNIPDKATVLAIIAKSGYLTEAENGEVFSFSSLELNKNGWGEIKLPENLPAGEWRLYVWAVADEEIPLAGTTQLPLVTVPDDSTSELVETAPIKWLFVSSNRRVQAMEMLGQLMNSTTRGIEQSWAVLAARHYIQNFCGGALPQAEVNPRPSLSDFQLSDGALTSSSSAPADPMLSFLVASMEGQAVAICDKSALIRYLKSRILTTISPTERAMALSGLMALGQPVLQEIKLMLSQTGMPPEACACLIWGLVQAGDVQVAKVAWQEWLADFTYEPIDANVYSAEKAEDTYLFYSMGALASAACGDTKTAVAMLQYLPRQESSEPLVKALVALALLQHCYAETASAALSTSFVFQRVEIRGNADYWLKLTDSNDIKLDNVNGDIDFVIINY